MAASRRRTRNRSTRTRIPADQSWTLSDQSVERAILSLSNEHARELEVQFGEAQYQELQQLAREAAKARRRRGAGPRVLILPGIMGSRLGISRPIFDDVYWFDPLSFSLGIAKRLALDSGRTNVQAIGVFLFVYLKMKLMLTIEGFDASYYPFDWRLSIQDLGAQLARDLSKLAASTPVSLVAHSMGGLVGRAAMQAGARVRRLVMLGTPSFGSFSPVMALRGVHGLVKKLAALDLTSSAEQLAQQVFTSFPGLYEMLPSPQRYQGTDFFDPASWPTKGPKVRPALLKGASKIQSWLAPATDDTLLIAGMNRSTVTSARLDGDEFVYESTYAGDGTVPWEFARLDGARTWFVDEEHGALPNNSTVIRAAAELLDEGRTSRLPESPSAVRRAAPLVMRESELRQIDPFAGRSRGQLRPSELRDVLREFAAPASAEPVLEPAVDVTLAGGEPTEERWERLTIGRVAQHRLEIQLAHASLTDVEARAYVLGMYREVTPTGPAAAVDEYLGGVISDFMKRRMFSAEVGAAFVLPANRRRLPAEMILFAGLGFFDRFNEQVLEVVAENVMRTFVRTRVEDFATVLLGAGSGLPPSRVLSHLLRGFIRGKLDADTDRCFRRITFCEADPDRYQELRRETYRLAATPLFRDVELSLTEIRACPSSRTLVGPSGMRSAALPGGRDPVYLLVRQMASVADRNSIELHSSVLSASAKASVFSGLMRVKKAALDSELHALSQKVDAGKLDLKAVARFGSRLRDLTLPGSVREVLLGSQRNHLVVVHDAGASRLPWETLRLGDWSPALESGMSRRYMADNLSVAKYLESRPKDGILDVLLIVNPTKDLPGAQKEGEAIASLLGSQKGIRLKSLMGPQATRRAILRDLEGGTYDVVHYAGHAFFDPIERSRSGLLCAGEDVLSGADLVAIGNLPSLITFNACESGRLRGRNRGAARKQPRAPDLEGNVGVAEALLRGGVGNFIGTYWPVDDAAAMTFSTVFYPAILDGRPLGEALLSARQAVQSKERSADWADYIHFGDAGFVVRAAT